MKNLTTQKEIGKRLKLCRLSCNMTQQELSEKVGLEAKSYSNIETGIKLFSVEILMKLSCVLDVSTDYILFGFAKNNSPISTMLQDLDQNDIARLELIVKSFHDAIIEKQISLTV